MSAIGVVIILLLLVATGFAIAFGVYYQMYTNYECETCPTCQTCKDCPTCDTKKDCPAPVTCPTCAAGETTCPTCTGTENCPAPTVCTPCTNTPTTTRTFTRLQGKDLAGQDIQAIPLTTTGTAAETVCLNACQSNPSCNAALVEPTAQMCYIKNNITGATPTASSAARVLFVENK
jgi:hypothetical protein